MSFQYTKQEVLDAFETMPLTIQEFLEKDTVTNDIVAISNGYNIKSEGISSLVKEIGLSILEIKPFNKDYYEFIKKYVHEGDSDLQKYIDEINVYINQTLKCNLAGLYNDYVVSEWEESPYKYARHQFDRFILSKELAEDSLSYLNKAKSIGCSTNIKILEDNIKYAQYAIDKHIDWGFDRTLGLSDIFIKFLTPFVIFLFVLGFISSGNFTGVIIGLGFFVFYVWIKFVPGWKIHERQYSWDKMLAEA